MLKEEQTRREFCGRACQAVSLAAFAGALGSVLEGCGGGSSPTGPSGSVQGLPVVAATDANGAVVVTIDSTSPLAAVGSAALVQSPSALVLVAHVAQSSFTALSSTCTHQACRITGYANQTFVCPCHGSQFNTSGGVVNGPAFAPLAQFHTQFTGNTLTITA
jgi:cytochrome b6-f complex iron-sulfur subunit